MPGTALPAVVGGPVSWQLEKDEKKGYRTYTIVHRVKADVTDGPFNVSSVAELPQLGDSWSFRSDSDAGALCLPYMKVTIDQEKEGDPARYYLVEQKFSNDPNKSGQCQSNEDPLLEPQKVSGSFVKTTREAFRDRYGTPLMTSSWEQIRGSGVEFDHVKPTVHIEQNVAELELPLLVACINHVNDSTLWGVAARCIKLSQIAWEQVYTNPGCTSCYHKRIFDFDIDFEGFDRYVPDEGTKALNGEWDLRETIDDPNDPGTATIPNPNYGKWRLKNIGGSAPDANNPTHFCRYKDRNDEIARVLLDGAGLPASSVLAGTGSGTTGDTSVIKIEYYDEVSFLLLGIPTDLDCD